MHSMVENLQDATIGFIYEVVWSCMEFLGFSPCKADPDIWMRKAKRVDNTDCWEYELLYVDN